MVRMAIYRLVAFAMFLTVALGPDLAAAAPGTIDPTFSGFGVVTYPSDSGAEIAVQPDGKIVQASQITTAYSEQSLVLVRRGPNGGTDMTWGVGGVVEIDLLAGNERVTGIDATPQGEILVVVQGSLSTSADLLARFSSTGDLAGTNELALNPGSGLGSGQHLAAAPDGSAFVVGNVANDLALSKHRPNGSLDLSFATDGVAIVDTGMVDLGAAVLLQFDGKILVAGTAGPDVLVARFTADGSLDPGFGTGGVLVFAAGTAGADRVGGLALHADGDAVIAGADGPSSPGTKAFLARVKPDGTLDTSFGGTGVVLSSIASPTQYSLGDAVVAQADGKTILIGHREVSVDNFTERYDASGALDPTWGTAGSKVYSRIGIEYASSAALVPGRLIVGGYRLDFINPEAMELVAIEIGEFCGDGIVQAGETCDDGGFLPGGCCSETCTYRAAATPCADDGNTCTTDLCDGAGTCAHSTLPDGTGCEDELTCTTGETCTAGVCGDGVADDCTNPLVCYKARLTKGTPKFAKVNGISLDDAIEAGSFDAKSQFQLCLPADVDAETAPDPDTRHVVYKIKPSPGEPKHVKQTSIVVTDALGTHTFDTKKPDLLFVPADMRFNAFGTVPPTDSTMHYKCYKVRQTPGAPRFLHGQVTATDEFESRLYDVFSPRRLCYAVDKNGEGILETDSMLTCYRARRGPGEPNHDRVEDLIHTIDQFGTLQLDTKKTQEICLPATPGP